MAIIHLSLLFLCFFTHVHCNTVLLDSREIISSSGQMILLETLGTFPYHFSSDINGLEGNISIIESGCGSFDFEDVEGFIAILFEKNSTCRNEKRVKMAIESGALAVGFSEVIPGEKYNYFWDWDVDSGEFAVFSVSVQDVERWRVAMDNNFLVTVVLEEINNPFWMIYESPWFLLLQVGMLELFMVYGFYICWKLYRTIKNQLSHVLIISLGLEIVANFMRLLYWIDPMGSRRLFTTPVSRVLFSLSYAPSILGQLLLSLYWMDSFRISTVNVKIFLSPISLVILGLVGLIIFILSILMFIPSTTFIRTLFSTFFVVAVICLLVFYIYIIIRLACFSRGVLKKQNKKSKKVYLALAWYSLSAFFCLAFIIVGTLVTTAQAPGTKLTLYSLTLLLLFGMSFCKVFPISVDGKLDSSQNQSTGKSSA